MSTLSERLRAEGMVKGMRRGMAEGMERGERAFLARLIERRFGPLTAETRAHLENANQQQLEIWADRILDAKSLEQVFQDH